MKIISLNLAWTLFAGINARRIITALKTILDAQADIVFLQEVGSYHILSVIEKCVTAEYQVLYRPRLLGPAGGLVILTKATTYSVLPYNYFSKTKFGLLGGIFTTLIINNVYGEQFSLTNVHLTPDHSGTWSRPSYINSKKKELCKIEQHVAEHKHATHSIVAGDFNAPLNSHLVQYIISDLDHVNVFDGKNSPTFNENFLKSDRLAAEIDYIFIRSNATPHIYNRQIIFSDTDNKPFSDHGMLVVEIDR